MTIRSSRIFLLLFTSVVCVQLAGAQTRNQSTPSWWNKYQHLLKNGPENGGGATSSLSVGANVDVSNECGPQSETYVTLNPNHPTILAGAPTKFSACPCVAIFPPIAEAVGAAWT